MSSFLQSTSLLSLTLLGLTLTSTYLDAAEGQQTAIVEIDYGDGSERRFVGLKVSEKTTVQSLLDAVARHPRGVAYRHRGSGATAFLTELDGVKNEGRGKNWVFRINGKLGVASFGVTTVKPGAVVRWTFGAYQP